MACQFFFIALNQGLVTLHTHYFGPRARLLATAASILLLFAPILIGAVFIAISYWRMSDGLDRLKWTESQIEAAHKWAGRHNMIRTAKWLLCSFVIAEIVSSYLVFHVWKFPHHSATKLFFDSLTLWCIPPLVVSDMNDRLRLALPKQTPPSSGTRRNPGLHSEHWGERKSPDRPS
jgi:hypothetical protein